MTFKAKHWSGLRIDLLSMTCVIILLGSVLGTQQIFKSWYLVYTIRGFMEGNCSWCECEVFMT